MYLGLRNMNLCIPTLNRYDKLEECVRSALIGKLPPENIYIIDNGNNLDLDKFLDKFSGNDDRFTFFKSSSNLGVSKSWNKFIDDVAFPMIISNDDVIFGKYDISTFAINVRTYPEYLFFHTNSLPQINMFSCFCITKRLVDIVGKFDTQFYPAYYEDNDYRYRMHLAGLDNMVMAVNTTATHSNSSTLAAYTNEQHIQHHIDFTRNRDYYVRKWGGLPEQEKFIKPFDAPF